MKRRSNTNPLLIWGLIAAMGLCGCSRSPQTVPRPGGLQAGDKAADFSLMDAAGHPMKLTDVQPGSYLILVFYRGHWCTACLNQLLNLKRDMALFTSLHAALAAVSTDTVENSAAFNNQWRFPFPLLSDTRLQLIDAYGARNPKGHDNKDISHPAVVIIDPQRIVRYKHVGKDAKDRLENDEILFELQKIQKSTDIKR
jgi:peroxiredoxin